MTDQGHPGSDTLPHLRMSNVIGPMNEPLQVFPPTPPDRTFPEGSSPEFAVMVEEHAPAKLITEPLALPPFTSPLT